MGDIGLERNLGDEIPLRAMVKRQPKRAQSRSKDELQCDVGVFGLFRPDRWLEAENGQLQKMEDALSTVFGNGRDSSFA